MQTRDLAVLSLVWAAGLALRLLDFSSVFPGGGRVRLGIDDSLFHARRALYAFENFPRVLHFDPYLAYPLGAAAPQPPGFDWSIAAVAWLLGVGEHGFEIVAAWISPLLSSLFPLVAFWIARELSGRNPALVAAALAAVLPSGILMTGLGNCDHHAAVALLAACWLALSLRETRLEGPAFARVRLLHAGLHTVVIILMLMVWSGSLLYVALGEGARLVATTMAPRPRERWLAIATSAGLAALAASAWVSTTPLPLGGLFTSQTLSGLHAVALFGLAGLALALRSLERWRPSPDPARRLLRTVGLALAIALPMLLSSALRESLASGLGFLAKQDSWALTNAEQKALFFASDSVVRSASVRLGYFAYLVPVAPLFVAFRAFRARGAARERMVLLLAWMTALTGLLLSQVRYGTDFTVVGSVALALALDDLRRLGARRLPRGAATALTALFALAMLWPVARYFAPRVEVAVGRTGGIEAAHMSGLESLFRFAETVRRLTPETPGFLDATREPEYGLLVPPGLGHLFSYVGRRPVPANNLGPYLNLALYRESERFYATPDAGEAIAILDDLQARYVVTTATGNESDSFAWTLHRFDDDTAPERVTRGSGRLRLVAAGPPGGRPLHTWGPRSPDAAPAYKLFERVQGALLIGTAMPGSLASAEIRLATPIGPRIYRVSSRVGESGEVRMRVPYADGPTATIDESVHPTRPWRVMLDGRAGRARVREHDVREGLEVPITTGP